MITIYVDYFETTFKTKTELPKFEYGCQTRGRLLRQHLRRKKPDLLHGRSEHCFVVEFVTRKENKEFWRIGT